MPTLPQVQQREAPGQVRSQQVLPGGLKYVGQGLEEAGNVFQKIGNAYDKSEADRISSEATASLEGAIKLNQQQITDPNEFAATSTDQVNNIHADAIASGGNERIKKLVKDSLANDLKKSQTLINYGTFNKKKDKVLANFADEETGLINQAASQDSAIRDEAAGKYGQKLAGLVTDGFMDREAAQKRMKEFNIKSLTRKADNEIEADPSMFLGNLTKGAYDGLDSDKRLTLRRSANAAISTAITIQTREQKVKQEAADREIQGMFDKGAGADVIGEKLKNYTAAGLLDRNDRKFWDDKLLKGETKDTPAQINNAEKVKAEFLSEYPSGARINRWREQAKSMRNSGDLGDTGASQIGNMLIMAERSANSEGRAQRAEQRALDKKDEPKKMTFPQAKELIARNFPNSNPNQPQRPAHKEDLREINQRIMLDGEDPGTVAGEVFTRREKQVQADKQRQEQITKAAKEDPKTAGIIERLNELKKKR